MVAITKDNFRKFRPQHVAMLLRGVIWQLVNFRFGFILLKGTGAKIWIDRRIRVTGVIKIDRFATLDLRRTANGLIGSGFSIGEHTIFRSSGAVDFICPHVIVGSNVTFGPFCNIGGGFGVKIDSNTISGPYVSIHPEEHGIKASNLVRDQVVHGVGIEIGADVWLGAKSTILDGSTICSGAVIGACTLVNGQSIEANGIYVGVPARSVGKRE